MYNLGIVIPTYNEIDNIFNLLDLLRKVFSNDSLNPVILVMDDNSPDGTNYEVQKFIEKYSNEITVKLIIRSSKQGLASAYKQGFKYLIEKFDVPYVMSLDADFSHNPEYIPQMYKSMVSKDSDLTVGSRYVRGGGTENWSRMRKIISRGGSLYAKAILNSPINDLTGGFNIYKSDIFKTVDLEKVNARGYLFQIEMKNKIINNGFKFNEYPIVFIDRINGKSKMSRDIVLEAVIGVWKERNKK
ncbi:MAG: polyprenol monophosphomannose synthase [Patescibacteria group bacterium]